jgi:hypothetical protein
MLGAAPVSSLVDRGNASRAVPADETCFHEFEASSPEVVEWVNERANAPFARILPAVRLSTRQRRRRSA